MICNLILEASPVSMLMVDRTGAIVHANQLAERLFGYPPRGLDGQRLEILIPDRYRARHPGNRDQFFHQPSERAMGSGRDLQAMRSDGSEFPVEVALSPMETGKGSVVFCSIVDITERKRTEALFRLAVEACPTAMLMVDDKGIITMANRIAERMLGYGVEELIGAQVDTLVPGPFRDFHAKNRRAFSEAPQSRAMGQGRSLTCVRKDGSELPVEIGLNPVETANGKFVLCSVLDITERHRYEQQLKNSLRQVSEAKEKAEAATDAKGAFLASMSHEIRTPLNGVLGMARILLNSNLNPEQREYAEIITRSGERLLTIINDILDVSKLDAGKIAIELVHFDLRRLLEELIELFSPKAAEKGLDLILRFPAELPSIVTGDSLRIHQILANLIGNAIKFTASGYIFVDVQCRQAAGRHYWRFNVEDTGIGISKDKLATIFESFEQADNSTSRKFGGSGLGLSISRRLAELMDGRVRVSTRIGSGSRFRLLLPMQNPAMLPMRPALPSGLSGVRLLLLSPHPVRRKVLAEQLAFARLEFQCLASAAQVRYELETNPDAIQLVVADVTPGDSAAVQLGAALRADERFSRHALVALTAFHLPGDRSRFSQAGFDAYLVHPVSIEVLLDFLASVWRLRRTGAARPEILTRRPPGLDEAAALPSAEPLFENRRVLVVDDDRVNQAVAVRMLEKYGLNVEVASDGLQALRRATATSYDAILMDCHMPVLDGYAATSALRSQENGTRHTPIIALTASAMGPDRDRCLAAGMDDFVTKPISDAALRSALSRWLKP